MYSNNIFALKYQGRPLKKKNCPSFPNLKKKYTNLHTHKNNNNRNWWLQYNYKIQESGMIITLCINDERRGELGLSLIHI